MPILREAKKAGKWHSFFLLNDSIIDMWPLN